MARPQKFRHSREALNDPQIAAKLGGFVLDIEALRTTRKQIDDQIAAAYDAVGDAGFEKKFVRKVVSLRAKETDARRDEEEGLEAYKFAVEKGVSLASARSKPVSSRSYAEAKGIDTRISVETNKAVHAVRGPVDGSVVVGELTDTQEQPEERQRAAEDPRFESVHGAREAHRPATYGQLVTAGETAPNSPETANEIPAGSHDQRHELVAGPEDQLEKEPLVAAGVVASVSAPHSPSDAPPAVTVAEPQALQPATVPIPNPQEPNSSSAADSPASISSPEPGSLSEVDVPAFLKSEQRKSIADYRPNCLNPDACGATGLTHCYTCRKAMEAASETEAAA